MPGPQVPASCQWPPTGPVSPWGQAWSPVLGCVTPEAGGSGGDPSLPPHARRWVFTEEQLTPLLVSLRPPFLLPRLPLI